jgi:hypothetical protein
MSRGVLAMCDLDDAAQLFGISPDKVLARLKRGKFLKPSADLRGAPVWERSALEQACNDYWKDHHEHLVWLHPDLYVTADDAAQEQIFYRAHGAVIYHDKTGPFVIHVGAGPRPANKLRALKRFGASIPWRLFQFKPRATR